MYFTTVGFLIITETDEEYYKIENCCCSLVRKITSIGFSLETFKVIGDNNNEVRNVLQDALKRKDIVITWGRLKKHRSWLYANLCDIFKQNLVHSVKLEQYLRNINLKHSTEDVLLPKYARFIPAHENSYPIIYLHRLYIIDEDLLFFRNSDSLIPPLEDYRKVPRFTKNYHIDPQLNHDDFIKKIMNFQNGLNVTLQKEVNCVRLKLSSNDIDELNIIQKDLFKNYGDSVTGCDFYDDYQEGLFMSEDVNIKVAINCIEECFNIYNPENVFISFNGGKDCTVLLHMMLAVLKKKYPDYKDPIFCMYVRSDNPFTQVDDFIDMMKDYYNLNIVTISSGIKEALAKILEDKPNLKACLLGTRRMDPFSENLEHFKKTDNGWPDVMRVSPLLDWDYVNIWDYLIDFKVPYCCLYDNGYTSLGNTNNTIKNPELKFVDDETDQEFYLPAHKLFDGTKERLGRDH